MPPEDTPTPRELKIYFENIDKKLDDLRSVVITRDLFAGTIDRISRLEGDLKDAERFEAGARSDVEKRLQDQITRLSTQFDENQQIIESAGRAKVNMWVTAALAIAGSILVKLFFPSIP